MTIPSVLRHTHASRSESQEVQPERDTAIVLQEPPTRTWLICASMGTGSTMLTLMALALVCRRPGISLERRRIAAQAMFVAAAIVIGISEAYLDGADRTLATSTGAGGVVGSSIALWCLFGPEHEDPDNRDDPPPLPSPTNAGASHGAPGTLISGTDFRSEKS